MVFSTNLTSNYYVKYIILLYILLYKYMFSYNWSKIGVCDRTKSSPNPVAELELSARERGRAQCFWELTISKGGSPLCHQKVPIFNFSESGGSHPLGQWQLSHSALIQVAICYNNMWVHSSVSACTQPAWLCLCFTTLQSISIGSISKAKQTMSMQYNISNFNKKLLYRVRT